MAARLLPGLALVFNAFVWGTAWWPFRHLQGHGMHPLWATAIVFTLASIVIVAARPQSIRQVLTTPALWTLVAAAGVTNASFNWAVTIGDVVRVVLLFYLMPLWTVVLARVVLHERLTPAGWLRIVLGVAGAIVVLWPSGSSDALPHGGGWLGPISLADGLGVIGGFSFAFNNVMLRREARRPEEGRALAMFLGGAIVATALAVLLTSTGRAPAPPAVAAAWVWPLAGLTLLFLVGNLALQYGAARLPANRTSVVMLTEVLFASASAIALGAGTLTARAAIGGSLIIAGALLAAVHPGSRR